MKIIFPDYYDEFKCTASACQHNCCIGWEIDIDEESLRRYAAVEGEFGKRLKKNIARRPVPHFILGEGERCPFLDEENLCDIYARLGEESLCDICSDHPRFRNCYSDRIEIGLGLCCEAVTELVLKKTEAVRFLFSEDEEEGESMDEEEKDVFSSKYDVLAVLQNRALPLKERIKNAAGLCGMALPELSKAELIGLFESLERLDDEWTALLELVKTTKNIDHDGFDKYAESFAVEFEQLAVYFVFRHFGAQIFDGCKAGAMGLAVLSLQLLYTVMAAEFTLIAPPDFARRCGIVRLYSAEIEYSQENVDTLFNTFVN